MMAFTPIVGRSYEQLWTVMISYEKVKTVTDNGQPICFLLFFAAMSCGYVVLGYHTRKTCRHLGPWAGETIQIYACLAHQRKGNISLQACQLLG